MKLTTPYYIIHERKLLRNLEKIKYVRDVSGAKSVLALKCFAAWSVFGLMREYMDGATSSSLYEARLAHDEFGKETHVYSVGFSSGDIDSIKPYADKIIFNSVSQLMRFRRRVSPAKIGLRVNPGVSYSHFDLADPARRQSRLGVTDKNSLMDALPLISGVMFHFNCENDDFGSLSASLDHIAAEFGPALERVEWVSLGGGIAFTKPGYPLRRFCAKIEEFGSLFGVQVYLEPGESAITGSAELVTKVVDIVHNEIDIAIVDASTEAHMLDVLVYQDPASITGAGAGSYLYTIAGRSCLAGDVFATCGFKSPLRVGQTIRIANAAGYTMVKKNWFNGLQMPSIVVRRLDGSLDLVRSFGYEDYKGSL